jgi:hypothetical protein
MALSERLLRLNVGTEKVKKTGSEKSKMAAANRMHLYLSFYLR